MSEIGISRYSGYNSYFVFWRSLVQISARKYAYHDLIFRAVPQSPVRRDITLNEVMTDSFLPHPFQFIT
jgi:hypothetical protein